MSALAWKRGLSHTQEQERDACLNCPLPDCVGRRHADCPICDPQIVIAEYRLHLRGQVTRAVNSLKRAMSHNRRYET
jgi:hypothetical protein